MFQKKKLEIIPKEDYMFDMEKFVYYDEKGYMHYTTDFYKLFNKK